jgi:riboflavin kinase / FMN adenylyltransferase
MEAIQWKTAGCARRRSAYPEVRRVGQLANGREGRIAHGVPAWRLCAGRRGAAAILSGPPDPQVRIADRPSPPALSPEPRHPPCTLFRDVDGARLCADGSAVCIGAFDGLHLGHQALVAETVARARALGLPAAAVTFEPLPREFFAPADPPPRLTLARTRVELLHGLGIDLVGLLRFDAGLAAMSAEAFVRRLLVGRLGARSVRVGPGFRFGHRRAGDLALLQSMGGDLGADGFEAEAIAPVLLDGERVSSTRVRSALAAGDFAAAARLLGRPYAIAGTVVHGRRLGRSLGYPTANLRLGGRTPPLRGIFATRVHGVGAAPMPSVSSLGTRPTVDGGELLLEAHLFDFDGDLYGRRIAVEFVDKLRDEARFDDLPALVAQMDRDAARARAVLAAAPASDDLPFPQRASA